MRFCLAISLPIALLGCVANGGAPPTNHNNDLRTAGVPSAAALAVVARWRAELATRSSQMILPKPSAVAEELKHRIAIEQAARIVLPERESAGLAASDWEAANNAIWDELSKLDADNTKYLKTILPADGWFRFNRDGEQVSRDAWLIVQHSPDRTFQRRVLGLMEPLIATGDASGSQYALLYDRVAMFEGRPQRYGSQIICVNGRFQPSAIENEAKLDVLRASVGLEPIAEYMRHWQGKSC